jgi:hypothetical protein
MVATMRYLHYEAGGIREYRGSLGLTVTRCDFEGRLPSIPADAGAVSEMLERSETLWGTALPYYLYISMAFEARPPMLKQAVVEIEASGGSEKFLIVAYQDGGLISVSGAVLPFQMKARTADWWAPYTSVRPGPGDHRAVAAGASTAAATAGDADVAARAVAAEERSAAISGSDVGSSGAAVGESRCCEGCQEKSAEPEHSQQQDARATPSP